MARLNATISRLSGGNTEVFVTLLITAALVVLIRLLGPLLISWDLSIQLEAAHRLAHGLGLTNAFSSQLDLNQPPISEPLVHYPPGLSLLTAGFLGLGLPLSVTLKTIYSMTTAIGWIAWSMLASRCLVGPTQIGRQQLPLNTLIAVILPIAYTPSWTIHGTDIVLWAGTPVVALLLLYALRRRFCLNVVIWLGLTIDLLLAFRYASGFLLLTPIFVICYQFFPKIKAILAHYCTFILSLILVALPVIFLSSAAQAQTEENLLENLLYNHGAKYLEDSFGQWLTDSIATLFSSFSSLYFLTGIDPRQGQDILELNPVLNVSVGLIFLAIFLGLPWLLIRYKKLAIKSKRRLKKSDLDVLFVFSSLMVSFVLFSSAIAFALTYSPLENDRYYYPFKFCLILIAYRMLTLPGFSLPFKRVAKGFVVVFVVFNLFITPAYYALAHGKTSLAALPFGLEPSGFDGFAYPSNKLLADHEETLQFLLGLEKKYPEALFFAQPYPRYMAYVNFKHPQNFRRIPDSAFWENAYVSQPTKIVWIIDGKDCGVICVSSGVFNYEYDGRNVPALEVLPSLSTVFVSQRDETTVMMSDLPANYRFRSL